MFNIFQHFSHAMLFMEWQLMARIQQKMDPAHNPATQAMRRNPTTQTMRTPPTLPTATHASAPPRSSSLLNSNQTLPQPVVGSTDGGGGGMRSTGEAKEGPEHEEEMIKDHVTIQFGNFSAEPLAGSPLLPLLLQTQSSHGSQGSQGTPGTIAGSQVGATSRVHHSFVVSCVSGVVFYHVLEF